MNCPFFGRSGLTFPLLIDTLGNQCGLVITSNMPCRMQAEGQMPDWRLCPIYKEAAVRL
jgi:hypothetical protein